MAESKVRNGNEAETIRDTAATLFINSVTSRKQSVTENTIDMQLIDLLNRSTSLNELLINSDNNVLSMEVTERPNKLKFLLTGELFTLPKGLETLFIRHCDQIKWLYSMWYRWNPS